MSIHDRDGIRIALIGCGEHSAENLIPSLAGLNIVDVRTVYDPDPAAAANAARRFRDCDVDPTASAALARNDIDAVVLAATPQVHYELSLEALARGLHVFVEKPPTVTRQQLERLVRAAGERNLVTCVGHNLRHTTAAHQMRCVIEDNATSSSFGKPTAIEMRYHASKPLGDRWGLNSPLRSFLLSHANHAIDFMIYQLGPISRVNAALASGGKGGIALAAQFVFESAAVGTLLATSLAPHFAISSSIVSDQAKIVKLESLSEVVAFGIGQDPKRWGRQWISKTLLTGFAEAGYSVEIEQFTLAALAGDPRACHPSFVDEIAVYDALDAIERLLVGDSARGMVEARG
jgi:predicted dehydrogenase